MIKQLLNSVSAKYRDLFVMCTIKIWLVNIGRTRTLSRPTGVSHSLHRVFAAPVFQNFPRANDLVGYASLQK